jgi:ParB/RepB/Spo0J family partition protein
MAASRKKDVSLAADLLAEARTETTPEDIASTTELFFEAMPGGKLIPIERVDPWDRQPRKAFDEASLAELARSIAAAGLIEPLVVRRNAERPGYYLVIAGHRRLLAARRVHGSEDPEERRRVATLPCVIREATEATAFADALVENLVRKDLTRREVMDAIKALKDEYGWSIREIGRRTGRDHKDLSELIRIAEDPEVAALVAEELITPTAAGPLVEARNHALRAPIIELIRARAVRTSAEVEQALEAERERQAPRPRSTAPPHALPPEADSEPRAGEQGPAVPPPLNAPWGEITGQVGDIPHLTITTGADVPVDEGTPISVIPVSAHTRRIGASARAEALAHAIMSFVRQGAVIDPAAIDELERAQTELDAYLDRQRLRGGA